MTFHERLQVVHRQIQMLAEEHHILVMFAAGSETSPEAAEHTAIATGVCGSGDHTTLLPHFRLLFGIVDSLLNAVPDEAASDSRPIAEVLLRLSQVRILLPDITPGLSGMRRLDTRIPQPPEGDEHDDDGPQTLPHWPSTE